MASNLTAGNLLQASRHKCSQPQVLLQPEDQPDEYFCSKRFPGFLNWPKLRHLSCDHCVGEVPGSYHSRHSDWLSKQGWSPIGCLNNVLLASRSDQMFCKWLTLGWIYRMKIISLVLVGLAATSPPTLRASSLKDKNNDDDFQPLFEKVQGDTWTTR